MSSLAIFNALGEHLFQLTSPSSNIGATWIRVFPDNPNEDNEDSRVSLGTTANILGRSFQDTLDLLVIGGFLTIHKRTKKLTPNLPRFDELKRLYDLPNDIVSIQSSSKKLLRD